MNTNLLTTTYTPYVPKIEPQRCYGICDNYRTHTHSGDGIRQKHTRLSSIKMNRVKIKRKLESRLGKPDTRPHARKYSVLIKGD